MLSSNIHDNIHDKKYTAGLRWALVTLLSSTWLKGRDKV
jgi:hypothetical protein